MIQFHLKAMRAAACVVVMASVGIRLQADTPSVDLSYVLSGRQESLETAQARVQYETARTAAERAGIPGDLSLTLSPTTRVQGYEGEPEPRKAIVTTSIGLSIPLALSAEQAVRADSSAGRALAARAALDEAERNELTQLIGLYHATYLAQREHELAVLELSLARRRLTAEQARFERGEIRFLDFQHMSNEFLEAEFALLRAERAHRESVMLLATISGIDHEKLERLAPPALLYPDGMVQESTSVEESARVVARHMELQAAERALELKPSMLSFTQVRVGFDYLDHSASVSLNPGSRVLSASYTPAGITLIDDAASATSGGSSSGSGSSDFDWNLSLAVSFALSTNRVSSHEQRTAELAVEAARLEVIDAERKADEGFRVAENDLQRSLDAVRNAVRARERAELNLELVRAREAAQQLASVDVLAAEIAVERALLQLEQAQMQRDRSLLLLRPELSSQPINELTGRNE